MSRFHALLTAAIATAGTTNMAQIPATLADTPCMAVTEIMIDPLATPDASGEWIELSNYSQHASYDLDGWTIADATGQQAYTIDSSLTIGPGAFALLAASGDPASNGGIVPDIVYGPALPLNNQGDTVRILDPDGAEADVVAYTGGQVSSGAALACRVADAGANDAPGEWYPSDTPLPSGDFGTPGAANEQWSWGFCAGRIDVEHTGPTMTEPGVMAASPNPGRPPFRLIVDLDSTRDVRLSIVDALGRVTARLDDGTRAAGRHEVVWDGRRSDGRLAAAGRYWLQVRGSDRIRTLPIALLR